ncbi:MAG: beta-ketoacyl synthase N-terminal-like domain-containing protein [Byssovorax sp.]
MSAAPEDAIAVIGLAGRFPGAPSVDALWDLLRRGERGITTFSDAELLAAGVPPTHLADPRYVKARGALPGIDLFDAEHFGFLPREAALLDPQHRLLLECAWEALESAGHASPEARRDGRVGVFAGASRSAYEQHLRARLDPASIDPFAHDGTLVDFLASRISHRLDLRGPSVVVQTACSTSLVAVHLACQSLLTGESDLAIAGAASIAVPSVAGAFAFEGGITSPDGWCRPFDARAAGTVGGDAVAAIVLKRLAEAIADRDLVHAVILGSAINNDGGSRVGFTAPSATGQAQVIRDALAAAGIASREIGYLEAHGSGTPIGDPIEIEALARAFADDDRRAACPIGSIKASIGHTDVVAGLAGMIKAILCLRARTLVATAGFERPSPQIPFAATPFFVQSALAPWPSRGPRRAGVSSFGMGGTNAHVVLEEAPPPPARIEGLPWKALVLSARSRSALEAMTSNLADHLAADPGADLAAVAATLASGRALFIHRRAALASSIEGAARALADRAPGLVFSGISLDRAPKIAFVHAGLGEHHPGMAAALYRAFPVFRASIDRSAEVLLPLIDLDVRGALLDDSAPVDPFRRLIGRAADRGLSALSSTTAAQPALLSLELALQALWASLGVVPAIVLGHSLGELAAAVAAGVFTPDDALALAAARARLIASLPPGAMTAVALSALEIEAIDAPGVTIAVRSGPSTTVVAGSIDAVSALERGLALREITCKRLDVEHAVHTEAMRPIAAALTAIVARFPRSAPRIPYLSSVTGARLTADEATRPTYWAEHLCHPVALAPAIDHLVADPDHLIVEIGPGAGLASLARLAARRLGGPPRTVVTSLPEGRGEDLRHLLGAVAELWVAGAPIDWRGLWPEGSPGRVPLPTTPFERSRHWIDGPVAPHNFTAPEPATKMAPPVARPPRLAEAAAFRGPRSPRERALTAAFQASFGFDGIGVDDDFFALGGHSLLAIQLLHRLRATLGVELSVRSLIEHRTIAALAERWDSIARSPGPASRDRLANLLDYAVTELADALALPEAQVRAAADLRPLGLADAVPDLLRVIKRDLGRPVYPHEILARPTAAALADLLADLRASTVAAATIEPVPVPALSLPPNPPIGLILSSARSGSTLLRVMLAGHPDLFCPPELHLLMFRSLREREAGLPSPHFGRGLARALMELEGLDAPSAAARVAALQAADASVQDIYRLLQDLTRPRLLVDKSPSYAERVETLDRALATFRSPRLVHLVRHPYAVIESYVRNRIGSMARAPAADPEAQGERHWVLCNRNVLAFLARTGHPAHRVRFEDLVADPDRSMRGVCAALGVEPRAEVLVPYDGGARMIDGVGDPGLHERDRIEPELGEAWRRIRLRNRLGAEARALAQELGYELPNEG